MKIKKKVGGRPRKDGLTPGSPEAKKADEIYAEMERRRGKGRRRKDKLPAGSPIAKKVDALKAEGRNKEALEEAKAYLKSLPPLPDLPKQAKRLKVTGQKKMKAIIKASSKAKASAPSPDLFILLQQLSAQGYEYIVRHRKTGMTIASSDASLSLSDKTAIAAAIKAPSKRRSA